MYLYQTLGLLITKPHSLKGPISKQREHVLDTRPFSECQSNN